MNTDPIDNSTINEAEREQLLALAQRAQKQAEEDRRDTYNLFMQAPAPIVILRGKEYLVELANPPVLAVWGRKREEVMHKPLFEALPEIRGQGLEELLEGVLKTGNPYYGTELKVQLARKGDGILEDVYFTFVYTPLHNIKNEPEGIMVFANDVTDQVVARKRIEESEARFRAIVNQATAGIAETDLTGRFILVNDRYCDIVGYRREELLQKRMQDITHPDDLPYNLELFNRMIQIGENFVIEKRYINKDGSYTWVNNSVSLVRDTLGNPQTIVAITLDITHSKNADAEIANQRQRLYDLFMQAPAIIAILRGPEHVFELANSRYMEIIGPNRNILGKSVREALPELQGQGFYELLDEVYRTEKPFIGNEMRVRLDRRGNGELEDAFVNFVYQPTRDTQGHVDGILVHAVDVTDQVEARQKVKESEARLRFMAESMPQKIFTAKSNGDVDYLNQEWMHFTGLSLEQIKGWGWTQFIHPDDVEEAVQHWKHSINTGEPIQLENRYRRHDGEYRWHLSRAHAMRDEHGKIVMWIGSNTDIDDQKKIQQQKDEFLSVAAHELKTPVTSIRGFAQTLLRRFSKTDIIEPNDLQMALRFIDEQATKLTKLVSQLLDISRLNSGKLILDRTMVDIIALANGVVQVMQPDGKKHRIAVHAPSSLQAYVDPLRLEQVLINLLDNAIKFSPPDRPINLDISLDNGQAQIAVTDHGVGIPPEHRPYIFDRYYQVHSRQLSGMGLGLSISRQIMELHGGTIKLESPAEGGTRFIVIFPLSP